MVDKKAKEIILKGNSNKEFFIIHGYTGSPSDFNGLGEYLNKSFKSSVRIMRLKGHGTKIQDLDDLELEDFLEQVESEFKKIYSSKKKIVLCGYSFGSLLALHLASKYPVSGLILAGIPFGLAFPFSFPGISIFRFFKKYWKKRLGCDEKLLRCNHFYYTHMHANAIPIINKINKNLKREIHKINCPIFIMQSSKDHLCHPDSPYNVVNLVSSKVKDIEIYDSNIHNIFLYKERFHDIRDFIKKNIFS